jgi:hypothetical protein
VVGYVGSVRIPGLAGLHYEVLRTNKVLSLARVAHSRRVAF